MAGKVIFGVNDLNTRYPELAKEWHPELNGSLLPQDVLPGSNKKAFWKCLKCNYEWESSINNRVNGRGCPCCSNKVVVKGVNDLATTHPEIAKEWYQPLNGEITPCDVTHGCGKKYNWMCPRGHVYSATVLHRTNGSGTKCPICNRGRQTSFAEQAIYYYVKKVFSNAINGYKDIFSKGMELDIYIPDIKIGIEYDGVYWHHKRKNTCEKEQRKYDICKKHGIKLIRIREQLKDKEENPPADWCIFFSNDKFDESVFDNVIKNVIDYIINDLNDGSKSQPDIDTKRDKYDILSYLQGPVKNSVKELAPDLVKEWDYGLNGNLTPDMIAGGSTQYVHWVCSVCGYKWEAGIYHRVKGHTGCPRCAGFVFEKGVNDLSTKNPDLLMDWDYDENSKKGIYPNEIKINSTIKVSWKCHTCGYKWKISVRSRAILGDGCRMCGYKTGKEVKRKKIIEKNGCISDPFLLKEWDYENNRKIGLFPEELPPGSNKSAFWICSKCGHKWKAIIAGRNKGKGCRKCADKANPELKRKRLIENGHALSDELLLKEWDYEKNSKTPQDYTYGSNVKVHWICSKCGHEWCAAISSRHRGAGCPACAGNIVVLGENDLLSRFPELAKEWDCKKNNIAPCQVSYSSGNKFWWICPKGHDSYIATPSHRVKGTGCPICGRMKIAEKARRPVDQLSLDGSYIKTFESVKAASSEFNLSTGAISNAIRKGTTSGGYRWRHHNKDED